MSWRAEGNWGRTVKLALVRIQNFRAIECLELRPDPRLTVLHGDNAQGKTSVLSAIAAGLGAIPTALPGVAGLGLKRTDRRDGSDYTDVFLRTHWNNCWGDVGFVELPRGDADAGLRRFQKLSRRCGL